MKSTKAQLSTTKKLLITLLVIVLMISLSGKLYSQARRNVQNDFDPNKFFNNDEEGEEALASGIANLLPVAAKKGARELPFLLFNHDEFGATGTGQLVLIEDFNFEQPFFYEQTGGPSDKIGMRFTASSKGLVVYFTKTNKEVEKKSLFLSYETDSYLKNKNLCFIPSELHAPLISAITEIPTDEKFPPGVTIDNLAEKYRLSSLRFSSPLDSFTGAFPSIAYVNGHVSNLPYAPIDYSGSFANEKLSLPSASSLIIPPKSTNYNGGLLVWIYGNNLCIVDRGFKKDIGLHYNEKKNKLMTYSNGRMSDLLLTKLITDGYVKII